MSVYDFKGRMRKTFGEDKMYISENAPHRDAIGLHDYWSGKFKHHIKRMLLEEGVTSRTDYDLKNIHNIVEDEYINFNQFDGTSPLGRIFYEPDDKFIDNYHEFLKWFNKNIFQFDFYFQATPTIRFNCANAQLTGEDRRLPYPRYHCDVEYGHPPQEINLWWSFTDNEQSGFSVSNLKDSEKWYGEYDFDYDKFTEDSWNNEPNFVKRGESISEEVTKNGDTMILFDSRIIHSAIARKDKTTRVSLDVRLTAVDDFVDGYVGKGRMGAEFKPGGKFGYHEKSIKNL